MDCPEPSQVSCRKHTCSLCHQGLAKELDFPRSYVARYRRPTSSSLMRAVASKPSPSYSKKATREVPSALGTPITTASSRLLDLPAELRIQIYAFCVSEVSESSSKAMCRWVRGVGYSALKPNFGEWLTANHMRHRQPFCLWADRHFRASLLLTCKTIYHEALPEMYRQIHFQFAPSSISEFNLVRYWLTKHPLQFTATLEIHFALKLYPLPLKKEYKLSEKEIEQLGQILANMPYLRSLDLLIALHTRVNRIFCSLENQPHAQTILARRFAGLLALRDTIPSNITVSVNATWTYIDFIGRWISSHEYMRSTSTTAVETFCATHNITVVERTWHMGSHFVSVWKI
jgi:hypothetical protein